MSEWLARNKLRVSLYTLIVINILVWSLYFSLPDGKLHIKVFDVGQGDAIYVETAGGYKILVDGGPDETVLNHLGKELPFYSRKLDLVIVTHPQTDHYTGLIDVVKRYQLGSLWVNGESSGANAYKLFEQVVASKDIEIVEVKQGNTVTLPDETRITVLWPNGSVTSSDPNAYSIVLHLSYGRFDAYLTGDADAQVQPYTAYASPIEFFKVPHHGGKGALNETYVSALEPEVSVISAGEKNPYGHPRDEVVNFLAKIGSKVYQTSKNGTVEIVSDGNSWYTKSDK